MEKGKQKYYFRSVKEQMKETKTSSSTCLKIQSSILTRCWRFLIIRIVNKGISRSTLKFFHFHGIVHHRFLSSINNNRSFTLKKDIRDMVQDYKHRGGISYKCAINKLTCKQVDHAITIRNFFLRNQILLNHQRSTNW